MLSTSTDWGTGRNMIWKRSQELGKRLSRVRDWGQAVPVGVWEGPGAWRGWQWGGQWNLGTLIPFWASFWLADRFLAQPLILYFPTYLCLLDLPS